MQISEQDYRALKERSDRADEFERQCKTQTKRAEALDVDNASFRQQIQEQGRVIARLETAYAEARREAVNWRRALAVATGLDGRSPPGQDGMPLDLSDRARVPWPR